jgi:hypothetical protein
MSREPRWFTVRLALVGSPMDVMRAVVSDLREELGMRPHLKDPRVLWDDQEEHVLVDVDTEEFDPDRAAATIAEEVFEATMAVLGEFERFRVDILGAQLRAG